MKVDFQCDQQGANLFTFKSPLKCKEKVVQTCVVLIRYVPSRELLLEAKLRVHVQRECIASE